MHASHCQLQVLNDGADEGGTVVEPPRGDWVVGGGATLALLSCSPFSFDAVERSQLSLQPDSLLCLLVVLREPLRPQNNTHVLQQQRPWLGAHPRDRDGELDVPDLTRADCHGGLKEAQGVLSERNILQLHLASQQGDAELGGVEQLEVFAQVVVQEPGGKALQHLDSVFYAE